MDLRRLSNLHIFATRAFIKCDAHEPVVSRDVNSILSTIPNANQVTQLSFRFDIYSRHPYSECLEQDWVGMWDEVVRISAGKPLELFLEMSIVMAEDGLSGDELYERIKEKIEDLPNYANICTYLWHKKR